MIRTPLARESPFLEIPRAVWLWAWWAGQGTGEYMLLGKM